MFPYVPFSFRDNIFRFFSCSFLGEEGQNRFLRGPRSRHRQKRSKVDHDHRDGFWENQQVSSDYQQGKLKGLTIPKTNSSPPENQWLEDEISFYMQAYLHGAMLVSGRVIVIPKYKSIVLGSFATSHLKLKTCGKLRQIFWQGVHHTYPIVRKPAMRNHETTMKAEHFFMLRKI